jgi:subtilisin family serine protease
VGHADCVHGTHVAGIAAGRNTSLSTGEPKEGVAPQAKLLAINVFTVFSPTSLGAFDSDIIKGQEFVFAKRNAFTGMKIASINMSLGDSVSNSSNCNATSPHTSIINQNRNANIATAIASGNNGFTNGVSAPGCVSTAITVGASDKSDNIASFSNMGSLVDVMAPGVRILSSVVSGSGYAFFSGTSMATPHIAGSVAALRTLHTTATVAQIQSALKLGPQVVDDRSGGTFTRRREDLRKAEEALTGVAVARTGAAPSLISVRAAGE